MAVRANERGQTQVATLRHSGSTKLVFPFARSREMDVILVNTAGGVTGGDRFDLDLTIDAGATLTLTTQAAERAYRAKPGQIGRMTSRARVATGGTLHWLPQEMILFDHAALTRRLTIEIEPGARLLMAEPVVFGRAAMREEVRHLSFTDRIDVQRDGRALYRDCVQLTGDARAHLTRPAIAGGAGAVASILYVDPTAAQRLNPLRTMLPTTGGASLIAEDALVVRLLADDSFELRKYLMPILERLSDTPLPTSWRL